MKTKILRRITAIGLAIACVFTMFSATISVSAAEVDSSSVAASYKGTTGAGNIGVKWLSTVKYTFTSVKDNKKYTVTHSSGTNFSIHYFAKSGQSLDYSDKSQWAFCLQPEANVTMSEGGTYGSNSSVAAWNNLKDWQKYAVSYLYTAVYSLSKSTYNKTYTSDFNRYYCAAQLLEHEVVAGFRNSDFSNNGSSPFISGGKVVIGDSGNCSQANITSAYNNLVSTLKNAVAGIEGNYPNNTGSSTSNAPTFTLKQTGANTYTYKDTSAHTSYKYYDILVPDSYKSYVKVSVKDNKLTITSTKALNNVVLTFQNKTAQSLWEYKKNHNIGDINVMMPSSSNNQAVATGSTVFVPKRYIKLTTSEQGVMKLYKISSNHEMTDNNDCYSLAGAKYQFFTDKACTKPATNSSGSYMYITTDANGVGYYGGDTTYVTASLITSYYLKEVQASKGYKLCTDEVHQFKKSSESNKNGIPIYTITCEEPIDNDPIGVLLQKENASGKTENIPSLEGAEFTVKFYGGMYYTEQELSNKTPLKTWIFKTDNNGAVYFLPQYLVSGDDFYDFEGKTSLPKGTVSIQETKAPSNDKYLINDTLYIRQILDENSDGDSVITWNTLKVPEEEKAPEQGYVKIHKTDGAGTNIGGATYGVYSSNVTNSNGMISSQYLVHPTNGKIVTANDGTAVCKVPLDIADNNGNPITYYIQEISVPSSGGWALDKTIYPFVLTTANSTLDTALNVEVTETPVKYLINKVDENNKAVEGATLQIRKVSDNSIVQVNGKNTFISAKSPVSVPNLIEGVQYKLIEVSPPAGYWKSADVVFTAKQGVNTVKMVDKKTQVKFAKVDENGNYVPNAILQIREANKITGQVKVLHEWRTTNGLKTIEGLTAGKEYQLFERSTPTGKITADNVINFTVTTDSQIETITMVNYPTRVSIKKIDDEGKAVIGAKLRIDDMTGKTVVSEWTTDGKAKDITGVLRDDTDYKLVETYNPKGYVKSESVVFHTQEFEDDETVNVVMTDPKTRVVINKVDESNNKPIVGATLHIEDAETLLTVVEPWMTDGNAKEITGVLEAGRTYLLCEDEAPAGYGIANAVEFTVSETAEVVNVTMKDPLTQLEIRKVNENDNCIEGAILQIIEKDTNKVITSFRSESSAKNLVGIIKVDTDYILHEVSAPAGKATANDVEFNLSSDDVFDVYTVTMVDPDIRIEFNKVDESGNLVKDVTLQVLNSNKTKVIDEWVTDGKTNHQIVGEKLTPGLTYYLHEVSAPKQYQLASDKKFTVKDTAELQTVKMVNKLKTGSVTLNKQDEKGNALAGSEWALFKADGTSVSFTQTGNGQYFASPTGKIKNLATDTNGKLIVSQLDLGSYYFVETKSPTRYMPYGKKIEFTISADSEAALSPVVTSKNDMIILYETGSTGVNAVYFTGYTMLAISLAVAVIYALKTKKQHNSK